MDQPSEICSRCGASVTAGQAFCPNCGQRISADAPLYPPTQKMTLPEAPPPATAFSLPPEPESAWTDARRSPLPTEANYAPPPPGSRSSSKLPIIVGGLMLLCLCGVVGVFGVIFVTTGGIVGGLALLSPTNTSPVSVDLPPAPTETLFLVETPAVPAPTEIIPMPLETDPPQPTAFDFPTQPSDGTASDNPFYDDFSTDRDWPEVNDPDNPAYTISWLGDLYEMAVIKPKTQAWVFPPTDYTPDILEFDAILPDDYTGNVGGTFGVLCHFVDADNYHEVELDIFNDSYSIRRVVNNQSELLTPEAWVSYDDFNKGPGSVNRVVVSCQGDTIALEINGAPVTALDDPDAPFVGEMHTALAIATYEDMDEGGYRMWFDNFIASMLTP